MIDNKLIQEIAYRLFNTIDGKAFIDWLLENYITTSPHIKDINSNDLYYFTGKTDLARLLYNFSKGTI